MELMFFCQDSVDLKKLVDVLKQFFQGTAGEKDGMQNYVNLEVQFLSKKWTAAGTNTWDSWLYLIELDRIQFSPYLSPRIIQTISVYLLDSSDNRELLRRMEYYVQTLLWRTWKDKQNYSEITLTTGVPAQVKSINLKS